MNKKFSTLMLGMLLTSAFASAQMPFKFGDLQKVDFKDQKVVDGTYIVVSSSDNTLDASDRVLSVVKSVDALSYAGYTIGDENASDEKSAYEWSLEVIEEKNSGHYFYALKNAESGTYLTIDHATGTVVTDPELSKNAEKGDDNSSLFVGTYNDASDRWKNGNTLYLWGATSNSALNYTDGVVKTKSGASYIFLCQFAENDLNSKDGAATLNKVKGGEGFNFEFSVDNKDAWSNDILTDLNLKAFYVSGITIDGTNRLQIPAGIYFASEYPASLIGEDVITDVADFKACTFVAVNPDVNYGINKAEAKNGIGFELMTVSGSAMNFYKVVDADDENENASEKGDVSLVTHALR